MGDAGLSPVSKFRPAAGITVDRTLKSIEIMGVMELSGVEATLARAKSVEQWINQIWTATFADGYKIRCQVAVRFRASGVAASAVTQIYAERSLGPSHVNTLTGTMTLNANEADAFTWTAAHEFGHILGLQDRYSESILSKLKGTFGGARTNSVSPQYTGNLMAQVNGRLTSQNVIDLAEENKPSSFWINDDDQVAEWVNTHSVTDIANLSADNKIAAIKTLMGGWISGDDMKAIKRILGSVFYRAEANAIRAAINALDFSDLGQRTEFRVALSQMP